MGDAINPGDEEILSKIDRLITPLDPLAPDMAPFVSVFRRHEPETPPDPTDIVMAHIHEVLDEPTPSRPEPMSARPNTQGNLARSAFKGVRLVERVSNPFQL